MSVAQQCVLATVSRATVYAHQKFINDNASQQTTAMNKIAGLNPDKSALDTDLKAGADKAGAGEGGKGDFIGEASPGKVQCKCLNCGHK